MPSPNSLLFTNSEMKKIDRGVVLSLLRKSLKEQSLSALIIGSADAHQSEYVRDIDMRRAFVSGFDGSAGTALVTDKEALCWTDGRYWLQASKQLSSDWAVMKDRLPETPSVEEYLASSLSKGDKVAIDPWLVATSVADKYKAIFDKAGITLVSLSNNPIDAIWQSYGQVKPTKAKAFIHPLHLSGQSSKDKIENIRKEMKKEKCSSILVSALDEIAWLFNIRGSDVKCNPVIFAYAIIEIDRVRIFIDENQLDEEVKKHLNEVSEVLPYEDILNGVKGLKENEKVWVDFSTINYAITSSIPNRDLIVNKPSPIVLAKAVKNDVELQGVRNAHARDAAACCSFFQWLEERVLAGDKTLTEVNISDKLEEFRRKEKDFVSLSFDTISGFGPNGAIIHYHANPETCAAVNDKEMYLCDSGAQYRDGTTDITRTFHFGTPTPYQRRCFTRVLQGHISIASSVFPSNTMGHSLDAFARQFLWQDGLDYEHGTGHGVGAFLNVHEGPHGISKPVRTQGILPGMITSNEPGYYEEGGFGIRIESLVICKKADIKNPFRGLTFCEFETITYVPIERKLIVMSLLSSKEIDWMNAYHKMCWDVVSPLLHGEGKEKALQWLQKNTQPL